VRRNRALVCSLLTGSATMKTAANETPTSQHPQLHHSERRARVLLAEDDYELRLALAELLEFEGYGVRTVASGSALLDYLASWILREQDALPVDVIITDVRMPGFNGLNIVEGLRATGWRHPIIVISAFGEPEMRERVARMGRAVFIDKPIDSIMLERALEELLD
jgi:CheY-like chemotaxis protein